MEKYKTHRQVLILVGCYLPGVKGGGPIRTIANLVDALGDEIEFSIITMDRDLGDNAPYESVCHGQWNQIGKARVYYINPNTSMFNLAKLINKTSYDVLYLNSFFNVLFSIKPVFMSKLGLISPKVIVVAPRGEFSSGALSIKRVRKSLFIFFVKCMQIYKNVIWHASTNYEREDIQKMYKIFGESQRKIHIATNFGNSTKEIYVASDIASSCGLMEIAKNITIQDAVEFNGNTLVKICFLSRISPMKNLNYLVDVLSRVKSNAFLGIYGPIESEPYWEECLGKLKILPSNIEYKYFGGVANSDVKKIISSYDVFFVPSKGENFGHVFIEALSAGTPILVSDQTPWRDLEEKGIGWDISLENEEKFVAVIDALKVDKPTRDGYRSRCVNFAERVLNDDNVLDANRRLFLSK